MRPLRHAFVQRFVSLGLLLSLGLWLAAPAAAAPSLAQGLGLPGELESALAEALADAPTPEAFVERLAATLTDGEAAEDLADVLETEPSALLALLYGHLLQAFGTHNGLSAVPATAPAAASGSAPPLCGASPRTAASVVVPRRVTRAVSASRAVRPAVCLTAAQPLGP